MQKKNKERATDWSQCPLAGELVNRQQAIESAVDELLRAPDESIDDMLVTVRGLLSAVYQRPVEDSELALYIDQTVWVMCDPGAAEAHFRTPRHDSNGVYEAIVRAA